MQNGLQEKSFPATPLQMLKVNDKREESGLTHHSSFLNQPINQQSHQRESSRTISLKKPPAGHIMLKLGTSPEGNYTFKSASFAMPDIKTQRQQIAEFAS